LVISFAGKPSRGSAARPSAIALLQFDKELAIDGFSGDQVAYHCKLTLEAAFVEQPGNSAQDRFAFRCLTWEGHDCEDAVRNENVWQKTRNGGASRRCLER